MNTLALDAGAVYIGTDLGVLALPPGATAWEAMTNGMPNVAVFGLTVDGPRRRLIAATWGRGAFALALP